MHKPSKADVLKVAGEPVRWLVDSGEDALCFEIEAQAEHYASQWGLEVQPLYTESKLLAMYAAGAEAMRERAKEACDPRQYPNECDRNIAYKCVAAISTLPITPTNTEGEQDERKDYCGSCGEWTGGPLICCHESESANRKPNITKTEAIAVRQTRKESRND